MTDDTLTVRIDHGWKEKLEELASKEKKTKSEVIRKALIDYINSKEEKEELKTLVSKEYAEGKISFDDLIKMLGYEEAKEVAFYVHTAKKSLKQGLSSEEVSEK
ncbi:MAG: CopG family ribbon-helix-helix protein [Candidatus Natronoplasma sp.]